MASRAHGFAALLATGKVWPFQLREAAMRRINAKPASPPSEESERRAVNATLRNRAIRY